MTLKLFLADDSLTIQKIVNLAFSGEDVEIESTSTGESALDSIRAFKPDIVLMDVFMPGCSGYEVCAHIKDDPDLKHIPVVLLVGAFEPFDESEAARVNFDGHLTKPFDTSELIQTVQSLVGKEMTLRHQAASFKAPVKSGQEDYADESFDLKWRMPNARGSVSARVRESFLGSERILELFDQETIAAAEVGTAGRSFAPTVKDVNELSVSEKSPVKLEDQFSEEILNTIVDRVVRQLSADVIREVAWEVVPELSELIIRRSLEEQKKP